MKIWKHTAGAFLFAAALVFTAGGANSEPADNAKFFKLLSQARQDLSRWNYAEADAMSRELLEMAGAEGADRILQKKAHQFRASYCFYQGDYNCARDEMKTYMVLKSDSDEEPGLVERSQKLAEVWDGATEVRSEHFILRYANQKDAVLVETSLSTLESAYESLTLDFKVTPAAPVLVEIHPTFEAFQAATNLSEEALENSGTIAVCKYRRLMVCSPRIMSRGYSYRDTLSHEFVHFLIYRKYGEGIPIWLHEGLAKFEESRWRLPEGGEMSPGSKSLLASALRQDELISFDRMHPSFAYLKTPSQGQLAFAEVTTVIGYLHRLGGWGLISRLCDELSGEKDYRQAVAKVTGKDFDRFWSDWKKYARGLGFKEIPGMEISAFEIRQGDEGSDEVDDEVGEEDLSSGEEWKYARLGDLLRDRGNYAAALVEYEQARKISPFSVRILNKVGLCHYFAEEYEQALAPLEQARELYPGYSTTYINLGRAFFSMKKYDEAARALEQALDLNPFNQVPYPALIKIYQDRKDPERVKQLEKDFKIIMGT